MTEAPRMVRPDDVRRALKCGRSAAYAIMKQLGGWRMPLVGWVLPERAWLRYWRELGKARGDTWTRSSRSSSETDTGTATSTTTRASDISEPCTSETTAAPQATELPSPPIGKSKHALRLARITAQIESESRSAKRSTRSEKHRSSPA